MGSMSEILATAVRTPPESTFPLALYKQKQKEDFATLIYFTLQHSKNDAAGEPICKHFLANIFIAVQFPFDKITALNQEIAETPWTTKKLKNNKGGCFSLFSSKQHASTKRMFSDLSRLTLAINMSKESLNTVFSSLDLIRYEITEDKKLEFDILAQSIKSTMSIVTDELRKKIKDLGDIYEAAIEPLKEASSTSHKRAPR